MMSIQRHQHDHHDYHDNPTALHTTATTPAPALQSARPPISVAISASVGYKAPRVLTAFLPGAFPRPPGMRPSLRWKVILMDMCDGDCHSLICDHAADIGGRGCRGGTLHDHFRGQPSLTGPCRDHPSRAWPSPAEPCRAQPSLPEPARSRKGTARHGREW